MKLQVLGCSGGIGNGRRTTSLLVNEKLLIDAGTGVGDLSLDAMNMIRHIFFTHSHLDHVTCMPFLADTVFSRHETHVELCGLSETLDAIRIHVLNGIIWPDFTAIPPDYPLLHYRRPLQRGETVQVNDLKVTVIPVNHSVPGVGYLVDDGSRAFAFSGDTTSNQTFWDALNAHPHLDLIIVEVGFPDEMLSLAKISGHYTASLLAKDLSRLRHRVPIYISHMKSGMEEQIMKECRIHMSGYNLTPLTDGMTFDLS
ncbi:Beta-lactamase family protein [Gammaproteobacteria bacterium]